MKFLLFAILGIFASTGNSFGQSPKPKKITAHRDVTFAEIGDSKLKLNLILPTDVENPPLVVFIHGGGWKNGSYKDCKVVWLAEHGFAVASIGYRLSDVAIFPAQIHDCKGAIRWLRAHAEEYGYNTDRIGVCGGSAGGHLAALLGTSGEVEALEGDVGGLLDQSSRVQAVLNYYGPTDFVLRSKTQPAKTESPDGSVFQLLGGSASTRLDLAKLASPAWHVTKGDAPMLVLHGTKDETVFFNQAERIRDVYQETGLQIELVPLEDSGHGGSEFFTGENRQRAVRFFQDTLKANP